VRAALDGYRVEELPWAVARRRVRDALVQMGLVRGGGRAPLGQPSADSSGMHHTADATVIDVSEPR